MKTKTKVKFSCNVTNINKEVCINSFDLCCRKLILGWMAPYGIVNEPKVIKYILKSFLKNVFTVIN